MIWYNEYIGLIRGCVRPAAIIMLVATLCASVIMEQTGHGASPWWFSSGVGLTLIEWIFERAVNNKKNKTTNMEKTQ